MKDLILVQTAGPFGDSTSAFDVNITGDFTVDEFINHVLTTKPMEWGDFIIGNLWNGVKICEYRKGEIIKYAKDYEKKYKNKVVWTAKASGGWSMMNYGLTLDAQK